MASKEDYKIVEKFYKLAVKKNNLLHEHKVANSMSKNCLYKFMNKKLKRNSAIPPLRANDGEVYVDPIDKANLLNSTFEKVFIKDDDTLPLLFQQTNQILPMPWTVITPFDVKSALLKMNPSVSRTPDEVPVLFLKHCVSLLSQPLSQLFNLSLSQRKLPKIWKEAIVIPIFKRGLHNNPNNFRPISLTSAVCRVMEKIIQEKITDHLMDNNLFHNSQNGFLPNRSTLSLHINLFDDLTNILDNKTQIDMLYLDFSKAFDRVSHKKILHMLTTYKIDPQIMNWLKDYLNFRRQRTVVENTFSSYCETTSGVPQGSVLGPMLFILYIQDLLHILEDKFPSIKTYAFADDLKLLGTNPDKLQEALNLIQNWTQAWQLKIQPSKSECISFHLARTHQLLRVHDYNIDNNSFARCNVVKDLGLCITDNLKWSSYIQKVHYKSNYLSHTILKTFSSGQAELFIHLYKTYIRPLLEYNVSIWNPQSVHDKKLAENTQIVFTRKLCKKLNLKYNSYLDRLKTLKLETLEYRRLKQDLVLVYKILNSLIDVRNGNMFKVSQTSNSYNLRRHSIYLESQKQTTVLRQHYFSSRIVNTWNRLPNSIVTSKTLSIFKSKLNKFDLSNIYQFYFS